MKLTDFGIIFSCVLLCFVTIWGSKCASLNAISYMNLRYNQAVDTAVTDALFMLVELDDGTKQKFNIEEAKKQFFKTLSVNLNMNSELQEKRLEEYVPIMCFMLPEGFYIYYNAYVKDKNGDLTRKYTKSEQHKYVYEDRNYLYEFSFTEDVVVTEKKTDNVYQGCYKDVARYCSASVLLEESIFEDMRQRTIAKCVKNKMSEYGSKYAMYGGEYVVNLPEVNDSMWMRTVDTPGMLAVVQGLPYYNLETTYSRVAFGGARMRKK